MPDAPHRLVVDGEEVAVGSLRALWGEAAARGLVTPAVKKFKGEIRKRTVPALLPNVCIEPLPSPPES